MSECYGWFFCLGIYADLIVFWVYFYNGCVNNGGLVFVDVVNMDKG